MCIYEVKDDVEDYCSLLKAPIYWAKREFCVCDNCKNYKIKGV